MTNGTEIAERNLPIGELSRDQLELVKRTVASGATDDELRLFIHDCQRRGVHPLDRLLHFTKRGGKYTPITGIDFMRSRAADTGEYAGNDDPAFRYGDPDTHAPTEATVTVWRIVQGQRYAFTATARWAEYYPGKALGFMWEKLPHVMLGKVAEALALRKAFPQQLSGLYETSEMDQAKDGAGTERIPSPSPQELRQEEERLAVIAEGREPRPPSESTQMEDTTRAEELFAEMGVQPKDRELWRRQYQGRARELVGFLEKQLAQRKPK
jgi:phage recombination protein Bet